jgi:ubiquinone/menaquinone biosynthesis C-methylase UbiE
LIEQPSYDPSSVKDLFNEMAATYGIVNLLSSLGFTFRWRNQCVAALPVTSPTQHVADLMSGMGELWRSLSRRHGATTEVVAVDISEQMVRRSSPNPPCAVTLHIGDVLAFSPEPDVFDAVVSSFGLKTFNPGQQKQLALQVGRLLRPGGVFSFVEISVPPFRVVQPIYMFYLKRIIPLLGRVFLGNPANYRLLGVYTEAFGDCRHFARSLDEAGLEAHFVRYFFGCATGVFGSKPGSAV